MSVLDTSLEGMLEGWRVRAVGELYSGFINRRDEEALLGLWTPSGIWELGLPFNSRFAGKEEIRHGVMQFFARWSFYVQPPLVPVLTVNRDWARVRWMVQELAKGEDPAVGYSILSVYEDELLKVGGQWLLHLRVQSPLFIDGAPREGKTFHFKSRISDAMVPVTIDVDEDFGLELH